MKLCFDKNIDLIVIKDESNKFTEEYGNEILTRIYNEIHKLYFKNVLCDLNKIEKY